MMPPDNHASMSPSKLPRILACPGSHNLAKKYERERQRSEYAEEGTMLHSAVEIALKTNQISADIMEPKLDPEQLGVVQDCVDYFNHTLASAEDCINWYTEEEVYLKEYHACLYDVWGTSDVIIDCTHELHVIDWKFGKGIPVYAENNDQLYAYAAGAIGNYENLKRYKKIHIHCIQPRLDSYDTVTLTPAELAAWLNGRLIPGVVKALDMYADFIPGHSQCRWCPAKVGCRARFTQANKTAAEIFAVHTKLGDTVTDDEVSKVLLLASQYEAYIKDIRVYIQQKLMSGEEIAGWKLVAGRSIRRWKDTVKAELFLLENYLDVDQVFISKLISPAQAEKAARAVKKDERFLKLVEKPEGKPTLVKEGDKRPPIQVKTAAEKFKEAL